MRLFKTSLYVDPTEKWDGTWEFGKNLTKKDVRALFRAIGKQGCLSSIFIDCFMTKSDLVSKTTIKNGQNSDSWTETTRMSNGTMCHNTYTINVGKVVDCEFGECEVKPTKSFDGNCVMMEYRVLNSDLFSRGTVVHTQSRMFDIDDNKILTTMLVNDFSMKLEGTRLSH